MYYPPADSPSMNIDPLKLEELTPVAWTIERRIEIATACRDMDAVPRVSGAGQVQALEDGTRVQIMHNGLRVLADGYYGDWVTRLIELCHGCHEPQEERVFHEVMARIPAAATMIELGGYWSFYSLWFLSGGKERRSIVVEPDPKHLLVGKANARLNGLRPTFVQAFAGGTPAPPIPFKTIASGEILLPRLSVPSLMESHKIKQLDVLHCDIQGAEFDVLNSCEELFLEGRIQFLFVSTHCSTVTGDPLTHQRCLAVIQNCAGKIIAEHDVHESYSCDGLIVAYFGDDQRSATPVPVSFNRYSESLFRNPLYDLAVRAANNPPVGDSTGRTNELAAALQDSALEIGRLRERLQAEQRETSELKRILETAQAEARMPVFIRLARDFRETGNRFTGGGVRALARQVLAGSTRRAMSNRGLLALGRILLKPFPKLAKRLYRLVKTTKPLPSLPREPTSRSHRSVGPNESTGSSR
jgi:FkbM family methyltransferase